MGKDLKFSSAICTDRFQSERLLALGLKKETADMCHTPFRSKVDGETLQYTEHCSLPLGKDIPAWSLHRLLMMLDSDVQTDGRYISLPNYGFVKNDNIYDNLCDSIEWLIKEGYFNKEYLV